MRYFNIKMRILVVLHAAKLLNEIMSQIFKKYILNKVLLNIIFCDSLIF